MTRIFAFLALIFANVFATPVSEAYTRIYSNALDYSTHMHDGQKRKVTKEPYIVHPIEVANILVLYGSPDDMDVIIAGLLHDVPEDTKDKPPYITSSTRVPKKFMVSRRFMEIYQLFGQKISEFVYAVLKDRDEEGDWLNDNFEYAKQLNTHPQQAILLSAADKLSNLRCMIMELTQKILECPDDLAAVKSQYWANFGRKKYPDYVVLGKFITLFGLYKMHLKEKYPALIDDLQQAILSIWNLQHSTNMDDVRGILESNEKYQQLYKGNADKRSG